MASYAQMTQERISAQISNGSTEMGTMAFWGKKALRKILENDGGFQLREEMGIYIANSDIKNDDIGGQNTYYWDVNHENSIS